MLFNSIDFAIFLPIVFIIHWFIVKDNLKLQNLLIVVASYVFYGWWDWKFLSLILFSTVVDFTIGRQIFKEKTERKRKILLWASIIINLGLLIFFKYHNFFLDNFKTAFTLFGETLNTRSLNIILPVGISFYTFQTLSYTIDIYRKKLRPTNDFIIFSAFVSFFPQLVAGPIERATNLLPQFYVKRVFDNKKAVDGMRQILWGLFKKMVIADNCSGFVNLIFDNPENHSGSTLFLGAVLFAFQIYGDFSGYSDIAIGTSRLFGFNLMKNFSFPYFSRDFAEFWRRWHISLSTWFRDYVYIPLGGSKVNKRTAIRNTFIIFIVSGFWHGPNWTFIIWGLLNAIYFLPLLLTNNNRKNIETIAKGKIFPSLKEALMVLSTFSFTTLAWVFFRAENIEKASLYLSGIFSASFFTIPKLLTPKPEMIYVMMNIVVLIIVEWLQRDKEHGLSIQRLNTNLRGLIYFIVILIIITFGHFGNNEFIYFQF